MSQLYQPLIPQHAVPQQRPGFNVVRPLFRTFLQDGNGRNLVKLNKTGVMIWGLCTGELTVGEIVELIEEAFPDVGEAIRNDVDRVIGSLKEAGVLDLLTEKNAKRDGDSEKEPEVERYLSFEPWNGGFNNVRMSLEVAYALAYMSGRILVLPPAYKIEFHTRKTHITDFFRIEGIPTIGFEDFKAKWGDFTLPLPSKRAIWSSPSEEQTRLWHGIENVAVIPQDNPINSVYCFPDIPRKSRYLEAFLGGRSAVARLGIADRARVVHFPQTLLGQFYTMIYTPDPALLRRAVRDGVRYLRWIFDAANKVVERLGDYSAIHARRNDFGRPYPDQVLTGDKMYENIKYILNPGETLYIATDERKSAEFEPLVKHYKLKFIQEYLELLPSDAKEPEFLPLIEQVICVHGRIFIGTKLSTMSAYIYRLRGYLNQMNTEYFVLSEKNLPGVTEQPSPSWDGIVSPGDQWTRDFPEAWDC